MKTPKYNYGDMVSFELDFQGKTHICTGSVFIIDEYGTIEQNEEPSYDVMVDNCLGSGDRILVKHIRESSIIDN